MTLANWPDKPMRWVQLAFVENDPAHIDLPFWLDYFRRLRADGACLSAGGYVAYYPTAIPLHHRSAWLSDDPQPGRRDLFGDAVAGCRELGMVVIARTDPHAIHQDAADAHPDWIAVDAAGNPRRHWSYPDAWVTCALGPYNAEFMTQVHQEIVAQYGVDGISISMPAIVGRRGVEEVLNLPLSEAELEAFQASAQTLKERLSHL